MKTHLLTAKPLEAFCAALASSCLLYSVFCILPSSLSAATPPSSPTETGNITYTWNPSNQTNPASMGGSGNWSFNLGTPMWDASQNKNINLGNTTVGLFGTSTEATGSGSSLSIQNQGQGTVINFNGDGGTIHRRYAALFANGTSTTGANSIITHTFNFAPASNYTFTNEPGGGSSRVFSSGNETFGGNSVFTFQVGAGAILNFQSSGDTTADTNPIAILGGLNLTGRDSVNFSGPGTINLGNNSWVMQFSLNSRVVAKNGVTLNLNKGSFITGPHVGLNGTNQKLSFPALDPVNGSSSASSSPARLLVANATVNVDGGTLNLAYRGLSSTPHSAAGQGIILGDNSGPGILNLRSGTIKALGDPRGSGTAYAGITFGGLVNNSKGGEFNQTGGTLITSNIRSSGGVPKSIINFNGGTVLISTDIARTSGKPNEIPSNDQIQERLDNFISGFANNSTNHVALGSTPTTFDTSGISTSKTNGLATIPVPIRDIKGQQGNLIKTGKNALRLTANNTYTGTTSVLAGALINNGKLSGPVTVAKNATLAGSGTFTDITLQDAAAKFNPSIGCNAKSLSSTAESINLIVNLSASAGKTPVLRLQTLNTTATLNIHLAGYYPGKTKSITLLKITSNAPKDLKVELFTNDPTLKSTYKDGTLTLSK